MKTLDSLPLPKLKQAQVAAFTQASLHAVKQPPDTNLSASRYVLGVDIGGSKLDAQLYRREHDELIAEKLMVHHSSPGGTGFGPALSALVPLLPEHTAVGIAVAGTVEGNRPVRLPNLPDFMQELAREPLASIFADRPLVVVNDAQAGLRASREHVLKEYRNIKHVLFVINGSGLGGSAWIDGHAFALEPGHVPVHDSVNPFRQAVACGMYDQTFTCLERVAGGVAGIQATWESQTEEHAKPALESLLDHDDTALAVYDASVTALAYVPLGITHSFGISDWDTVAVVCHGGVFGAPGYFERFDHLVASFAEQKVICMRSDVIHSNVCLYGAALSTVGNT